MTDDLRPLPELSQKNGVPYISLWRAATAGQVAAIRDGRNYLASAADVKEWAEQRKAAGR